MSSLQFVVVHLQHLCSSRVDRLCLHLPMPLEFFFCSKLLNLIMYIWWKHCPSSSLLLSSLSPPSCSHHVAPASSSSILSCVLNRTYRKYRSTEKFMKLPFQRVVIHHKRSPIEWVMLVSISSLRAVQKILECTTFNVLAIPTCRHLRLTWFLIRWNCNFIELLDIQKYSNCFGGRADCWWEQCRLAKFIRRCRWTWTCGSRSVMLCVLRLQGHHHWFTSE